MSVKFKARLYILDESGLAESHCWVDGFDPMDLVKRSSEEWVIAHLQESYSDSDLRAMLGLPAQGNFQVLIEGELEGHKTWTDYGDEYDESLDLEKVEWQPIPDDYLNTILIPPSTP